MQQSQWLKYETLWMKHMDHNNRVTINFLSYLLPQNQSLVGAHNHC